MKLCPRCGETKPADQWHRNASQPDGLAKQCKACRKELDAADYVKHKAARVAARAAYRRAKPEVNRAAGKRIYAIRPEQYRARNAARRSRQRRGWYPEDRAAIRAVYKLAATARRQGIACHVDHIVPLKGERVCGLHVSWNLQVIADDENQAKSNTFPVTDSSEDLNSACNRVSA